jgi:EccD-like transmembrane domain
VPWWGLAAAALAQRPGAAPALRVGAAAGGLLAGALIAPLAVPVTAATGPGLALALPAASLLLSAAAVVVLDASPVQAAAVVAVCLVPAATALPRLAIALAGISSGDEEAEVAVDAERAKVATGHALLTWLLVGAAVTLAAATGVLVASGGLLARCLAGAVAVATGLRARAFRLVGQVLPLALGALVGSLALELALASARPAGLDRQVTEAGLLLGTGAILVVTGFLVRRLRHSPVMRRRLDLFESLVNLLLIPICLGVLGLYDYVERVAQHFG